MIGRALDAVYYRIDLCGPDGRPAQTKVLTAVGFFFGLAIVGTWGILEAAGDGVSSGTVTAFVIVLALAFGLDGLKAAVKIRSGPAPAAFPAPYAFSVPAPHASPDAHAVEATAGELLPPVAQSRPEAP